MRLIYLIGLIAAIFSASFALQSIFSAAGISIDLMAASGTGQIINYAIVLLGAFLFTALVWRQSVFGFLTLYLQNWRKVLRGFAACAGLTFVIGLIWFLFVLAAGGARWSSAALAQVDGHALATLLGTALVAIALALTEEILFRALAFKYLLTSPARGAVVRAAILSAVIFALVHRFDDPLSWLELQYFGLFIGLVLLGCLFALVYYAANSLACSIGVHSGLIWIALGKKTQVIQVATSGWDISISFDPRTGPAAWILFVLLIIVFWTLRSWLRRNFAIENLHQVAAEATSPPIKIDGAPAFAVTERDWLLAILGVAACAIAFIAVQKSIDHQIARDTQTFPAAVDQFKSGIARGMAVEAAAAAARFRPAVYIRFIIETLRRNANGQVEIAGAATDLPGDGSPMAILVVAKGKTLLQVPTAGAAGTDFSRQFLPADVVTRNVNFSAAFSCAAGESISVAALATARTYFRWSGGCP